MTTTPTRTTTTPSAREQSGKLLAMIAGHVATRTVETGLHHGLFSELADHPDGLSTDELSDRRDLDPFYVAVWCRSALAAEALDTDDGDTYTLAPHIATLLLDTDAPSYVGGIFTAMTMPEVFDWFSDRLPSGERVWWDQTSNAFIRSVAGTGRPFYTRLIPDGLDHVPGLTDTLQTPAAAVLDTACGAGAGLVRLARTYPKAHVTGADGDAYSLELAAQQIADAGLDDRIDLIHSPLEDLDLADRFDVVTNNISMHECRDPDAVTANVHAALKPGGWFVISDFPFPTTTEGLRTLPGRIMAGIQCYEALIDDQLQSVDAYLELLDRHGFDDIDTVSLTPVHALTYGRR